VTSATGRAAAGVCPVCGQPFDPAAPCRNRECQWSADPNTYVGAAPPPSVTAERRRRLDEACRRYDLRAAVRVAFAGGELDAALLDRLIHRFVRSGPVDGPDRDAAVQAVRELLRTAGGLELDTAIDPPVERLVRGELDALLLVELDADGMAAAAIRVDDVGTPAVHDAVQQPDGWRLALKGLAPDREERWFQLASGRGFQATADDMDDWRVLLPWPAAVRWELVIVDRVTGWSVPDQAVEHLRGTAPATWVTRPGADRRSLQSVAAAALDRAPLRHAYQLVVADVDAASQKVWFKGHELFPAGMPVRGRVREVDVVAPPAAADRLLLPVVVQPDPASDDRRVVAAFSIPLRPGESARIAIELERPGHLRVTGHPSIRMQHLSWAELLGMVPERTAGAGPPQVDLVCAIELAGADDLVRARLKLAQDAIDEFGREARGSLRVGLLGYGDHEIDRAGFAVPVSELVTRHPLGPPGAARLVLQGWTSRPRRHEFATALEEALAQLESIGWRTGSRRVLLCLGSRPPHPPGPQRDRAFPCPNGLHWRTLLEQERRRAGGDLRCLAVTDSEWWFGKPRMEQTLEQRVAEAWAELGSTARFQRGEVEPELLPDAAGVAGAEREMLLPLVLLGAGGIR
jgi:hypothetical protein